MLVITRRCNLRKTFAFYEKPFPFLIFLGETKKYASLALKIISKFASIISKSEHRVINQIADCRICKEWKKVISE